MELIEISNAKKQLSIKNACVDGSAFNNVSLANVKFFDVNMKGVKIINANMSDLEIGDAQLGGAYIHNIGLPPKGHPLYDPNTKHRPLKFEDCDLNNSQIINCNLTGVQISDCNLAGTTINGILVEDLLKEYGKAGK